jgi:hypothetical protein
MLLIFWKFSPNFGYLEIERQNPECGEPSELQLVLGTGGLGWGVKKRVGLVQKSF